jgi:hypothetical protein
MLEEPTSALKSVEETCEPANLLGPPVQDLSRIENALIVGGTSLPSQNGTLETAQSVIIAGQIGVAAAGNLQSLFSPIGNMALSPPFVAPVLRKAVIVIPSPNEGSPGP